MSGVLLSMGGWYFLPQLVTGYAQTVLYTIFIRAGDPKPQPGSPQFNRDRRRIQIFVIVAYLLYTIYDADWTLQRAGDFYSLLNVPHDATERTIQSRFRRLTVQFHPDKVTGPDRAAIEATYMQIQLARDTLIDPAKRFAYDRFGPDMLSWRNSVTLADYVYHGMQQCTFFYIASGAGLFLLGFLGYLETGKFWRYFVMVAMYIFELHLMTRPRFPVLLTKVVNPIILATRVRNAYLPFQLISLARKISVTFFIALAQLAPLLQDQKQQVVAEGKDGKQISNQQLDRIDALLDASKMEASRLMGLELTPFLEDRGALDGLKVAVKEWLTQNTIRNDVEVRNAISQVVENRRTTPGDIGI